MPRRVQNWEGKYETREYENCHPCGKKLWFKRKKAAEVAAVDRRRTGEAILVYRCPNGGHGFHVGHEPYWAHRQRLQRRSMKRDATLPPA